MHLFHPAKACRASVQRFCDSDMRKIKDLKCEKQSRKIATHFGSPRAPQLAAQERHSRGHRPFLRRHR
ncbi:hypothetical protein C7U61_17495 [Rhizobium sp. JAB6]|nr:hypothetical protein C7U61_17495 [Rhizobium sp. JAB6]